MAESRAGAKGKEKELFSSPLYLPKTAEKKKKAPAKPKAKKADAKASTSAASLSDSALLPAKRKVALPKGGAAPVSDFVDSDDYRTPVKTKPGFSTVVAASKTGPDVVDLRSPPGSPYRRSVAVPVFNEQQKAKIAKMFAGFVGLQSTVSHTSLSRQDSAASLGRPVEAVRFPSSPFPQGSDGGMAAQVRPSGSDVSLKRTEVVRPSVSPRVVSPSVSPFPLGFDGRTFAADSQAASGASRHLTNTCGTPGFAKGQSSVGTRRHPLFSPVQAGRGLDRGFLRPFGTDSMSFPLAAGGAVRMPLTRSGSAYARNQSGTRPATSTVTSSVSGSLHGLPDVRHTGSSLLDRGASATRFADTSYGTVPYSSGFPDGRSDASVFPDGRSGGSGFTGVRFAASGFPDDRFAVPGFPDGSAPASQLYDGSHATSGLPYGNAALSVADRASDVAEELVEEVTGPDEDDSSSLQPPVLTRADQYAPSEMDLARPDVDQTEPGSSSDAQRLYRGLMTIAYLDPALVRRTPSIARPGFIAAACDDVIQLAPHPVVGSWIQFHWNLYRNLPVLGASPWSQDFCSIADWPKPASVLLPPGACSRIILWWMIRTCQFQPARLTRNCKRSSNQASWGCKLTLLLKAFSRSRLTYSWLLMDCKRLAR